MANMSTLWRYEGIAFYAYPTAEILAVVAPLQDTDYSKACTLQTADSEASVFDQLGATSSEVTFSLSYGSDVVVEALLYDPLTTGFTQVLEPTVSPRELVIPSMPFGQRYWLSVMSRQIDNEDATIDYGGWLGRVDDPPVEDVESVSLATDIPVGLPVEHVVLPESKGTLTLRLYCLTDDCYLQTLKGVQGGSVYDLTVPAWNRWYQVEISDEASGAILETFWIGHQRTH